MRHPATDVHVLWRVLLSQGETGRRRGLRCGRMIRHILQVKVPVTDLARSAAWYRKVFELELIREFVEHGQLAGAVLSNSERTLLIGLRRRDVVPGKPAFAGFDLFSFAVDSRAELDRLVTRFDELGVAHSPIGDRGSDGAQLDVADPDGTVVRILSPFSEDAPAFQGIEFDEDGQPAFYDESRLDRAPNRR